MTLKGITFPAALLAFQVLLIGLYAGFVGYKQSEVSQENQLFYSQFQDIHVMIIIGFGFLMTFLKKYGYGALSYNLLLTAVTIQWAILINTWISNRIMKFKGQFNGNIGDISLGIKEIIVADTSCTPILITFGAILGKASHLQLLLVAIIECVIFAINNTIITDIFQTADAGGTVALHLFGAYFGLAVSKVLKNSADPFGKEASDHNSDIFSMIGTLFLWAFWPSFNAGTLGDKPLQQNRAVINTYLAMAAGAVTSFVVSSLVNKSYKFKMVHMQNATLAAGVAVGICSDLLIRPWGAMVIGLIGAAICVLGFAYLTPRLNQLSIHDSCGVHNLHGMPALFGGLCGVLCAIVIPPASYFSKSDYNSIYSAAHERSRLKQGGFQLAAIVLTLAMAIGGGLITGYIISLIESPSEDNRFDDAGEFEVTPEQSTQYERITDDVVMT